MSTYLVSLSKSSSNVVSLELGLRQINAVLSLKPAPYWVLVVHVLMLGVIDVGFTLFLAAKIEPRLELPVIVEPFWAM